MSTMVASGACVRTETMPLVMAAFGLYTSLCPMISRLPVLIRIVLESVLRNFDGGKRVGEPHVRELSRGEQPMSGFERETRHHFDNARHFRE